MAVSQSRSPTNLTDYLTVSFARAAPGGGRRLRRIEGSIDRVTGAPTPPRVASQREMPRRSGAFHTVVMGCVSRPLTLSSSRRQTVSPWSRRAVEVDICQLDICRPDTCQPEQVPEAAAPCEADRRTIRPKAKPLLRAA